MLYRRIFAAILLFVLVYPTSSAAQGIDPSELSDVIQPSLTGLDDVSIYVTAQYPFEILACSGQGEFATIDEVIKGGMELSDILATTLSNELSRSGIQSHEWSFDGSDVSLLILRVSSMVLCSGNRLSAIMWSMSIEMRQSVSLDRDPSISQHATTWSSTDLGYTNITENGLHEFRNDLLEASVEKARSFALEYHRAN